MQFESTTENRAKREKLKQARQQVLDEAKAKFEHEERKEALRKARGEDTWMLPTLSQRLDQEREEYEKSHKKKKKEKKQKKKKHKKQKRSKHDSSGSDSDSGNEPMWVEKQPDKQVPDTSVQSQPAVVKGPTLQRDDWMTSSLDLVPSVTRQEIRDQKKKEENKDSIEPNLLDQPGQHRLELNPFWKDGGTGLPEEEDTSKSKTPAQTTQARVGAHDSGVGWLRKAYDRCVKTAQEDGRSLEEVAAERYGSLKNLQKMLSEAEAIENKDHKADHYRRDGRRDDRNDQYQRDGGRDDRNDRYQRDRRDRDRKDDRRREARDDRSTPDRHRDRDKESSRNVHRDLHSSSHRDSYYDKQSERHGYKETHSGRDSSRTDSRESSSKSSRLKGLFMKPNDDDSSGSKMTSHSSHRSRGSDSSSAGWRKPGFQKPTDDSDDECRSKSPRHNHSSDRKDERRFQKPSESSDLSRHSDSSDRKNERRFQKPSESSAISRNRDSSSRNDEKAVPNWKKKSFVKPSENSPKRSHSTDSSSDSSSSSSSSESEAEPERKSTPEPPPPVKILTEKEMNQLGAKIVRAELMGNATLAEKLKSELDAARKATESRPPGGAVDTRAVPSRPQEEEQEVVLTRTDRAGMVRPLSARQHPEESRGGRRKKEKVTTHDKVGSRVRYFHDDDKFDLKSMVEREKTSTAEDSNMMFARLAGRSLEKTDDDYQLDDMFVQRASKKQSDSRAEDKERAMAVHEHQKMAKALHTCPFCFENIPKHLIIAIGVKVYLCLPNHRSLTDGHCLIVPMHHVQSGTALDEDVWEEIQTFRKALVRMFESQDEDVVFMETSMHLSRRPHMALECVSVPREVGDMAPIYFKKALMECDTEWAQNKQVIDLSQKDVRRAVPKGFPYFAVDFGLQGGYAHVMEDEHKFTHYFGREIIGGMLDLEPQLWRRPKKEGFEDQRQKVLKFSDWWKPYDWTLKLKSDDS